jgi:tetratricopeptide (TPR) repeat protein
MKTTDRIFSISWTLLFLIASAGVGAHAQWIDDPAIEQKIQRGIDNIYNIEFEKADSQFTAVNQLRPDHPVGLFFKAMAQWWRILTNFDDESQDQRLYDMLEDVIVMCEKELDQNPNDVTALFFKGGAVGFRGRLRANRSKWLGAANDGLVALPIVKKAFELEPQNNDVLLGIGIYNYYAAVIPDRYPIVKPFMLLFPSGDRKKGLEQLKQASKNARYAKVEANYFLLQSYFLYEKEFSKALSIATELNKRFPKNPIFHRFLGRCYVSLGRLGEANDVFLEIERRFGRRQVGYDRYDGREAYYYLGKYEFMTGKLDPALKHLYACDSLSRIVDKSEPSGFMSLGNLMIGMIYDAQGRRDWAEQQYRKVMEMKEYENSQRDARNYLKQPYKRN